MPLRRFLPSILKVASIRQNGVSTPGDAPPCPGVENLRIRIDDPGPAPPAGAFGTGAIHKSSRRLKGRVIRRVVAIRRENADGDRPAFAAGTQAGCAAESRLLPSPGNGNECVRENVNVAPVRYALLQQTVNEEQPTSVSDRESHFLP